LSPDIDAERYFSDWVRMEQIGKREDDDLVRNGVNASRGPRDGVVADRFPDGVAVRNVPLGTSAQSGDQ
jgi:hypothetical protein